MKLFSNLDQHLIFSRKAEGTGLNNVWVAWDPNSSTRERVEWVNDDQLKIFGWMKVDSKGEKLVSVVNGKQYYSQWIVTNGVGSWSSVLAQ